MSKAKQQSEDVAILEAMTKSILVTTPDLDEPGPYITYVNRAFEKMTGWKREEILGKTPRILQGPKTNLEIFSDLRNTLDAGKTWAGRTVNYKKDGSEFYMQWSIAPVFDENGEVSKLLAVQEDVTENVRMEERLENAKELEQKRVEQIERANMRLQSLTEKQKKTLDLFTKYVPKTVVKKALSKNATNIRKGEKLDAALLFCDIRGFTSIAEKVEPDQVVRILNTYYTMMAEVIEDHKGAINQFIGDEIFVSFGAPLPIKEPEKSSVYCAIDMMKKLEAINDTLRDILPTDITVGIGINYGPVIAGNLGSDERLSYSLTGDTVNTAKRIESFTNEYSDIILISESIYEKIKELIPTQPWGKVKFKGKSNKMNIYQVV